VARIFSKSVLAKHSFMVIIYTNRLSERHSLERTAAEGNCKNFPVSKFNGLYTGVLLQSNIIIIQLFRDIVYGLL